MHYYHHHYHHHHHRKCPHREREREREREAQVQSIINLSIFACKYIHKYLPIVISMFSLSRRCSSVPHLHSHHGQLPPQKEREEAIPCRCLFGSSLLSSLLLFSVCVSSSPLSPPLPPKPSSSPPSFFPFRLVDTQHRQHHTFCQFFLPLSPSSNRPC